jgi:nitroreductase
MKRLLFSIITILIISLPAGAFAEETVEIGDLKLTERPKSVNVDLIKALEQRKSTRQYALHKISTEALSAILWAANGVNRPDGKRTAPSAYGKQYIDIYVATSHGFYIYDAHAHALKFKGKADIRKKLSKQQHVVKASHVLILVANLEEVPGYFIDQDIKRNWAHATAGTIAENVYLMASAKDVGTCLVAGLEEKAVRRELRLSSEKIPLYLMPLGYIN